MIATSDLRELAGFTGLKSLVVTLYLDTDLSRQSKDQVRLVLRELLDRARAADAPEEDLQRIARYVDLGHEWQGRSLVLFSCLADDLWQPMTLPVTVKSQIYVGDKAYLMPLSNLLDQYAPYALALVDQERARLFLIDMGGIVKQEDLAGDPIKRQKQGGWSAPRFQRHTDQQAQHNMRVAADALGRLCAGDGCERIILAGTEENTATFRDLLPLPLRQRVLGSVPLDIAATAPVVIERSRALLADLDEGLKDDLVRRAVTAAAKGGPGVTGLPDVLLALQEGRVMNLLVEEGFAAPGFECPSCDYHYVDEAQRCLFCGDAQARKVRNVVERAVHKAYLQGAAVEVVSGNADLARMGHIAALLRY